MIKTSSLSYNPSIDTLRAISIILVIISHWGPFHSKIYAVDALLRIIGDGQMGVDIFFVLSGYLISYGLFIDKESKSSARYFKDFFIKRFFRIFPVYYLVIFILYILNLNDIREFLVNYLSYTTNFLMFQTEKWIGFSHTWSLAVEEQFYLIWPFIVFVIPKKHTITVILFLIFFSCCFYKLAYNKYGYFSFMLLPSCLIGLCSGALMAYLALNNPLFLKKMNKLIYVFMFCAMIIWILIKYNNGVLPFPRIFHTIIAIGGLYTCISNSDIFYFPVLVQIGKISYGLYLYHLPLLLLPIQAMTDYFFVEYTIRLILLFILTFFSYQFFEKKMIDFSKKIISKQL